MGLGYALTEDTIFDKETGRIKNANFADYKILTFKDMPNVEKIIEETYEPTGPYGSKALGEGVTNPVAAAVTDAIHNACGIYLRELPCTPEKILHELGK